MLGTAKARVMTVAAILIAARRTDRDSSTSEKFLSSLLENGEIRAFERAYYCPSTAKLSNRVTCGWLGVPSQRRMESSMMTTAANIIIAVRPVLMRP